MIRALILVIELFVAPGVFASVGQLRLPEPTGNCPKTDPSRAAAALRQVSERCEKAPLELGVEGNVADFAQVQAHVNLSSQDQWAGLLARQQARELECSANFVRDLAQDAGAERELGDRLRLLRLAKQKLNEASTELARNPRVSQKVCPLSREELKPNPLLQGQRDEFFELCQTVVITRSVVSALTESFPLAHLASVRKGLELVANAPQDPADPTAAVREIYRGLGETLKTESRELAARAESPTSFSSEERRSLVSDPSLAEELIRRSQDPEALRGVACTADFLYRQGAENLETALTIGSWALTGAGAAVRAGSIAMKVYQSARAARVAGWMSGTAGRLVTAAALGVDSAASVESLTRECGPKRSPRVTAAGLACVSAPSLADREADQCWLAGTLSALQIGSVLPVEKAAALLTKSRGSAKGVATGPQEGLVTTGPRAAGSGVGKGYSPLQDQAVVKTEDLIKWDQSVVEDLKAAGVQYDKDVRLNSYLGSDHIDKVLWSQDGTRVFTGSMYRVKKLPIFQDVAKPKTLALLHPEMEREFKRMKDLGYDLVIDSSLPKANAAAYFSAQDKIIAIDSSTTWSVFQHELQHMDFYESVIKHDNLYKIQSYKAAGAPLERSLTPETLRAIGPAQLSKIQKLIDQGITPQNSIDETLAVEKELATLGWRKYVPGTGAAGTRQYALRHQITDLEALGDRMTENQRRLVQKNKIEHAALTAYDKAPQGATVLGGVAGLAGFVKVGFDYFERSRPGESTVFYDEKSGNMVEIRRNGTVGVYIVERAPEKSTPIRSESPPKNP